jgi:hypothetical protein
MLGLLGGLAADEAPDVASISGNVGFQIITCDLAAVEAADAATVSGTIATDVTLTAIEAADSAAVNATAATIAALAAAEASDAATISGATAWSAALAATEAGRSCHQREPVTAQRSAPAVVIAKRDSCSVIARHPTYVQQRAAAA